MGIEEVTRVLPQVLRAVDIWTQVGGRSKSSPYGLTAVTTQTVEKHVKEELAKS